MIDLRTASSNIFQHTAMLLVVEDVLLQMRVRDVKKATLCEVLRSNVSEITRLYTYTDKGSNN